MISHNFCVHSRCFQTARGGVGDLEHQGQQQQQNFFVVVRDAEIVKTKFVRDAEIAFAALSACEEAQEREVFIATS